MLGKEDLIKLKNLPRNAKQLIDNLISKTNKQENDINDINSDLDNFKNKMENVEHEDLIKLKNLPNNVNETLNNLITKTGKCENDIDDISIDIDRITSKVDKIHDDDISKLKNLPVNTTESFNNLINKTDNHGNDINNINAELNKVKSKVGIIEQQDVTVTVPIINKVLTLTTNKRQKTTMENNTTIVLPVVNKFTEIHLIFSTTEAPIITLPGNVRWQDDVDIEANKKYEFIFTYEDGWMGGVVVYR